MKKFKKLIPALCMLLVSAVMLGSTTFAWFSMNRTVTATGMEIKAEVSTQLLIKGSAATAAYKSAIDFSGTDSAVGAKNKLNNVPATAYKGRNETDSAALIKDADGWKKLDKTDKVTESGTIDGGAQDNTWDTVNPDMFKKAVAGTDYIKDDFTLKLVGEFKAHSTMKLTLTATTESTTASNLGTNVGQVPVSPIYKAIHVAIVATYTDGTYLKNIDLGDATLAYEADGSKATLTYTDNAFDAFSAANQVHSYSIYIWYDGEDSDCMNSNAANIDLFKFALNFEYVGA